MRKPALKTGAIEVIMITMFYTGTLITIIQIINKKSSVLDPF
jgi:hypothetical protein